MKIGPGADSAELVQRETFLAVIAAAGG